MHPLNPKREPPDDLRGAARKNPFISPQDQRNIHGVRQDYDIRKGGRHVIRPYVGGGGIQARTLDLDVPEIRAMTRSASPSANFFGEAGTFTSIADRIEEPSMYESTGIVYSISTLQELTGNDIAFFVGTMGNGFSMSHDSGSIATMSCALNVYFFSEAIDPETVTYDEMNGYRASVPLQSSTFHWLLGPAGFIPHPGFSNGITTTASGPAGYYVQPSAGILSQPVRTIWVELQPPGVSGGDYATATCDGPPAAPILYLN